jgi:hypothetical protein
LSPLFREEPKKATRGANLPLRPSEFSELAARSAHVAAGGSSSCEIGCPFRVTDSPKYRLYWLSDPASPSALASALRFSLAEPRWSHSNGQPNPLFEFHLPLESCPANPSRPAKADQLLSWTFAPFSTPGSRGPHNARFPGPASFRLQGLVTLLTVSSLRTRAGFVSRRRRSWDSPFGAFSSRKVSGALPPGSTHLPFHPTALRRHNTGAGPAKLRFLGFDPCESPWRPDVRLTHRPLDAPLGFAPSKASQRKPWPNLRPASSHALPASTANDRSPAPQSINRPSPDPLRPAAASRRRRTGQPF